MILIYTQIKLHTVFCNRPCRRTGPVELYTIRMFSPYAVPQQWAIGMRLHLKMRKLYLMRSISVRIRISPHSAYAPRAQNHRYIPHIYVPSKSMAGWKSRPCLSFVDEANLHLKQIIACFYGDSDQRNIASRKMERKCARPLFHTASWKRINKITQIQIALQW